MKFSEFFFFPWFSSYRRNPQQFLARMLLFPESVANLWFQEHSDCFLFTNLYGQWVRKFYHGYGHTFNANITFFGKHHIEEIYTFGVFPFNLNSKKWVQLFYRFLVFLNVLCLDIYSLYRQITLPIESKTMTFDLKSQ